MICRSDGRSEYRARRAVAPLTDTATHVLYVDLCLSFRLRCCLPLSGGSRRPTEFPVESLRSVHVVEPPFMPRRFRSSGCRSAGIYPAADHRHRRRPGQSPEVGRRASGAPDRHEESHPDARLDAVAGAARSRGSELPVP